MTGTATRTYRVGVIERAIACYEVEAEDARAAAENWHEGEYRGLADGSAEHEETCSVREQQPNGTWRKVPRPEWEPEPAAASDPAKDRYVIHSAEDSGYWSNKDGWGGVAAATVFTAAERDAFHLPLVGAWVTLKPYSVLLRYPDYANVGGTETYYAWVEAHDPIAAIAEAQRQAIATNGWSDTDPTDFAPLLVVEGHHYGQPLRND
jgi:hypothetical protein